MRLLFSFVYFFAGVAKTGHDWLSGRTPRELMRLWTGPTAPLILGRLGVGGDSGGGVGYKDLFFTCIVWGRASAGSICNGGSQPQSYRQTWHK